MNLYRIINENLVEQFPNWIVRDNIIYTNSAAQEFALESGEWYTMIINQLPEFDESTQYLIKRYHLEGDTIILDWDVHNLTSGVDANLE